MRDVDFPCIDCLAHDICTLKDKNESAIVNKVKEYLKPATLLVRFICDKYCSNSTAVTGFAYSGSCRRMWWHNFVPCKKCDYYELCKVDKESQDKFCNQILDNVEGRVQFCCTCYSPKPDKDS